MAITRERAAMSAAEPSAVGAGSPLKRQIPSFAAIGVFGYFVDSGVTYLLAHSFGLDPPMARLPAVAIATVVNFALNRAVTFRASKAPLMRAFARYVMVCAAGLAVNYCGLSRLHRAGAARRRDGDAGDIAAFRRLRRRRGDVPDFRRLPFLRFSRLTGSDLRAGPRIGRRARYDGRIRPGRGRHDDFAL